MNASLVPSSLQSSVAYNAHDVAPTFNADAPKTELREAFDAFVGQTFFGMMLKSMRETQKPTPYFHGGRGEEVFQTQLDQMLVEKVSEASADQISGPMFELFQLRRR